MAKVTWHCAVYVAISASVFRAGEEVYPASTSGGQGVAGSNPVHPTTREQVRGLSL